MDNKAGKRSQNGDTGGTVVPLWINGSPGTSQKSQSTFPIINSATGKTVHHAASASVADAEAAADAAWNAFSAGWRDSSPEYRRNLILKACDVLERRAEEIANYQEAETSSPPGFARWNVGLATEFMRENAYGTSQIRGLVPQRPTHDSGIALDGLTITLKQPIGPVVVIPPWNGAVVLPCRSISVALAAGCTIVLKASEKCPRTHLAIVEAFEEAGLPKGVMNVIQVRREEAASVTEALIAHKGIRKVDFIGSAKVGSIVGQVCSKYLKPCLMELGSKAPAVILDDADLEKAAKLCANGKLRHHGQLCFSTDRVIVVDSVYDKFMKLFIEEMNTSPLGNAYAVDETSARNANELLMDAENKGAKILLGGSGFRDAKLKNSLKPTIITGINRECKIWHEETFGPIATVYPVKDEAEAIAMANDHDSGLTGSVFSENWERALRVSKQIECGQVNVNGSTNEAAPTYPFRSSKGSGWGVNNSIWGISEYLVEKTIAFYPTEGQSILWK